MESRWKGEKFERLDVNGGCWKKVKQIKRKLRLEAKIHRAENQLCLVPSTQRIVKYRKIFVSRVFEGFLWEMFIRGLFRTAHLEL